MPRIWKKEINGKKYTLTQSGIFDGRTRKSKAKKHAEDMKSLGCLTKIEHREKQSVVWIRCKRVT